MTEPTPPVSYEAEQALIAAVLHANSAFPIAAATVEASDFADGVHARLWQRIDDALSRGETVSALTAHQWLQGDEALTEPQRKSYARQLAGSLVTLGNVAEYARIVRLQSLRRTIIHAAQDTIAKASDTSIDVNADELLAEFEQTVNAARGRNGIAPGAEEITAAVAESLKQDLPIFPTGLPSLDDALRGGLVPSKLYGIVARHKAGKTMLLTTMSYHLMLAGTPHLYLCLESTPEEIMQRMIGKMMGFNSLRFLEPRWRKSAEATQLVGSAYDRLRGAPLLFQRQHRMSLDALRSAIAGAIVTHKIRGVFVDYLQLVTGAQRGQSQAAWLDEITQTFAEISKRFGIFVVVAAQENQNENVRGGEGLLNACDMTLRLRRSEGEGAHTAWLEMMTSRFTPKCSIGNENAPAFAIDLSAGPMFVEIGYQPQYGAVA